MGRSPFVHGPHLHCSVDPGHGAQTYFADANIGMRNSGVFHLLMFRTAKGTETKVPAFMPMLFFNLQQNWTMVTMFSFGQNYRAL